MKKLVAILLIISILGLTSCTLMMPEPAPPEPTAPQTDIDEIGSSVDEIDDLEQELDISELDDLEKELDELDW